LQPQHRPRDLDYAGKERRRYRQRRRAHNDAATFANIDRFTRTGHELAADIIFYRNRIELVAFGGAKLGRNGQDVDVSKSMTYKSMLLSDVPTMAFTMGYINASWTLRADLVSEYVCRLLNCMDARGYDTVVAAHPGKMSKKNPSPISHQATSSARWTSYRRRDLEGHGR
jgi:cation diffusion facilitator CzcD-associated flavoprotein CzcO